MFKIGHKVNFGRVLSEVTKNKISTSHKKRHTTVSITCLTCGIKFNVITSRKNKAKFCSRNCNGRINGVRNLKKFDKGFSPWNKGMTKVSDERINLYSQKITGDKNYQWRGDLVSYRELHKWIEKVKGKDSFCECCGTEYAKKYDWANISGKYTRNLDDWIRLCRKCHIAYDRRYNETL